MDCEQVSSTAVARFSPFNPGIFQRLSQNPSDSLLKAWWFCFRSRTRLPVRNRPWSRRGVREAAPCRSSSATMSGFPGSATGRHPPRRTSDLYSKRIGRHHRLGPDTVHCQFRSRRRGRPAIRRLRNPSRTAVAFSAGTSVRLHR